MLKKLRKEGSPIKRKVELDKKEKFEKLKVEYDVREDKDLTVYVNGTKINSTYDWGAEVAGFRRMICANEKPKLAETDLIIVFRVGALEREIRLTGFVRKISVGEWE